MNDEINYRKEEVDIEPGFYKAIEESPRTGDPCIDNGHSDYCWELGDVFKFTGRKDEIYKKECYVLEDIRKINTLEQVGTQQRSNCTASRYR